MDAENNERMSIDKLDEIETHLPVSEGEQRALELYDKLQELRLEIAIINAQQSAPTGKLGPTSKRRSKNLDLVASSQ